MAELIIQSGKLKGKRLLLPANEMVVGRDDDCDLRIASSLVSRRHCILKSTDEGILVTDLGSQNGTIVNDVPIVEPTFLREGDTLRIGATILAVPASPKPLSLSGRNQSLISEADIADWLMDAGSNYAGSDTEVLSSAVPVEVAPTPLPTTNTRTPLPKPISTPAQAPAPVPRPQISKVLSVKDEAALVIKKHWEAVKAKQRQ